MSSRIPYQQLQLRACHTPIHSRTYVKLADGEIVYGDVASYTYNEVAGVQ